MSRTASSSRSGPDRSISEPFADWVSSALSMGLQIQEIQWEWWATWQTSLLGLQEELLDLWACRFAGGVPLDA